MNGFWATLCTTPTCEQRAITHCARLGVQTYAPRFSTTLVRRNSKVLTTKYLFPGYLFVQLAADAWRFILSIPGVAGVLMSGDHPAVLPAREILRLRAMEDTRGLVRLPQRPAFHRGQSVRVASGQLEGLRGLYEGMSGADRAVVLLAALGRAHVAARDLEAA